MENENFLGIERTIFTKNIFPFPQLAPSTPHRNSALEDSMNWHDF